MNNEYLQKLKRAASLGNVKAVNVDAPVLLAMIESIESLAAPAVANGAADERARFEAAVNPTTDGYGGYTSQFMDQWQGWKAAIASIQQAAPKQALTDADFLRQWEITRDRGGYSSMMFVSDSAIIAFARTIESAAAPNALLVAALKKIIEMNRKTAEAQYGDANKAESWSCVTTARAALASIPTEPEATK